MKRIVTFTLALALIFTMTACGGTAQPSGAGGSNPAAPSAPAATRTIKVSITQPETSPLYSSWMRMSEELAKKSDGEMKMEIYANCSLSGGNQLTALEMCQSGEIEITMASGVTECALLPDLNVICIPFMWDDLSQIDEALAYDSDLSKLYAEKLLEKDLVLLGFADFGFREITNNVRPIKEVEDFKNLKLRVLGNSMFNAAYTALGANPTDYNFNELYTAMQQGTVDGQENPISAIIIPQRYEEVQKYMSICKMSYDCQVIQMSSTVWNSLTESQQKVLKECMADFFVYQKEENRSKYDTDIEYLKDYGMEIVELSEDVRAEMKSITDEACAPFIADCDQNIYNTALSYTK